MQALPNSNPPTWIGLPMAAETEVQISSGYRLLSKLAILQGLDEDSLDVGDHKLVSTITESISKWQDIFMNAMKLSVFTSDIHQIPVSSALERSLLREISKAQEILSLVASDLQLLR